MFYESKSGKFKGKSVAQLYLTRYPELVRFIEWARDKPNLSKVVRPFDFLDSKIDNVKLIARCCYYPKCSNPAPYMSLMMASTGELSPDPYFWCNQHNPWEEVEKEPISIKTSERFFLKRYQRYFLRRLCEAIGITKVTKRTAEDFFKKIINSKRI